MRLPVLTLMVLLLAGTRAGAQPAAAKAAPPVFIDELTWMEIRDRMLAGTKTVIIGTAGQEQKGPHMVTGEHKYVLQHTTERIARTLGDALIAPIISPGGVLSQPPSSTSPSQGWLRASSSVSIARRLR